MPEKPETKELLDAFRNGSVRALARVLTRVENGAPGGVDLVASLFGEAGRALLVGITGSPGSGKSTLADRLAAHYVTDRKTRVGILAVDPSSPFSRGALLGDRIRMVSSESSGDVFIRSMSTRGALGGLAATTGDLATVMDAWGLDPILIETVGVGQDEVDIARLADVSVVVLVPGAGDEVQALKAGVMEIADVFVVNKSDREGADRLEHAVLSALELAPDAHAPAVLRTVATTGEGVPALAGEIERVRLRLRDDPARLERRRQAIRERLARMLGERMAGSAIAAWGEEAIERAIDDILARRSDPHSVVGEVAAGPAPGPLLEHVAVATSSLGEALSRWQALGLEPSAIEDVTGDRVRAAFLPLGESRIELLESTLEDSPVDRFVRKRGPGLHHIAIRVRDIDGTLDRLRAAGIRLVDEVPRRGADGSRIAFIHPTSLNGVLVELVEHEK